MEHIKHSDGLTMAKTEGAAQRHWRTPAEFPCCPEKAGNNPIKAYANNLKIGTVFCHNYFCKNKIYRYVVADNDQALWVITRGGTSNNPYLSLATVTYEDGLYIHEGCGNYSEQKDVERRLKQIQWHYASDNA